MHLIPTVIEKKEHTERAYDIYSRLLVDRIIILNGTINDQNASIIIAQLIFLDNRSTEDITLYINSPGGSVTAGLAIYDTMHFIKSDVATICVGAAASMASIILSSGAKGKRFALPNSEVMIHQPLGGVQGQASDIRIASDRIIRIKTKLNKILAKNTKQRLAKVTKDTDRDFFMEATDALNYGIIDQIIKKSD